MDVIETSKDKNKLFVFINMEDLSVSEYNLPQGVVGIVFQPRDGNQGRYEIAVEKFKEWNIRIGNHTLVNTKAKYRKGKAL